MDPAPPVEVRARLWLFTTNDDDRAQRFYEKCGLRRVRIHPGAVARARLLEPEIPETNADGAPIRDELEYEVPT